MKKYITNISDIIDCDSIIQQISKCNVPVSHGHMELPKDNPYYHEYVRQTTLLASAGYDDSTVEYRHYKCGEHFSIEVQYKLAERIDVIPLMCWISEIRPGKCTPWHWDINPWEDAHKKLGELVRYFCFISKPAGGHVFMTEFDAYYNEPQGNLYQYEDIHTWHAGSNVGLGPKFLLTLTAYKSI
jgi:hypothetical protein